MIKNKNEFESDTHRNVSGKSNKLLLKIVFGFAGVAVVACILIGLAALYKLWGPYSGPKVQIVLEPDYSLVSTVSASDLESAVEILNERSRSLGYGAPFKVADDNKVIALVPDSVDVKSLVGNVVAVGLLELVDFGDTPISPGTKIATDFDYEYFPSVEGQKWHTVMTNSEFKSVEVTKDMVGKYAISFTLTAAGTKTLSDFTADNVGQYLGIVLDKVVITSPQINTPISDGQGIIQGSFSLESAKAIAVYLRIQGPLPIPLVVKEILQIDK